MKRRQGFVSNSSSSSFVINLDDLNANQVQAIQNHITHAQENDYDEIEYFDDKDRWSITVGTEIIRGSTWMDNFDMFTFLRKINVPDHVIKWDEY